MTAPSDSIGTAPLFATPFVAVNTGADGEFNARLVGVGESRRSSEPPGTASDPLHYRSGDDFLDDANTVELKHLILGRASQIVAGLSSIEAAEFATLRIQARGWCSIVQPGGHVPAQHFSGASWLAVYCAQAGESAAGFKSAGVLRLYERRLGSIYQDPSTASLRPPYRHGNYTWAPVPGWMALFPAHLPHEVSVVRSSRSLILVFARIRFEQG